MTTKMPYIANDYTLHPMSISVLGLKQELVEIHKGCWNASMNEQGNWQQIVPPEEGKAVCFDLQVSMTLSDGALMQMSEQGFVICFQGELRAWRNHCPHAGSPLDWIPGQFFSEDGKTVVCHTHHAVFEPLSGDCIAGPCPRGLYDLPIRVLDDGIAVPVCIKL